MVSQRLIKLFVFQVFCALHEISGAIRGPSDVGTRGPGTGYAAANTLLPIGKFKEAADEFHSNFVTTRSESYNAFSAACKTAHTAAVHLKDGKYAEAAQLFREVIDHVPTNSTPEPEYKSTIRVFSNCMDVALVAVKAHVFLKQGSFQEAIDLFQTAQEKSTAYKDVKESFDSVLNSLRIALVGKALLTDGHFQEASDIFHRAALKSSVDEITVTLMRIRTQSGLAAKGLAYVTQLKCFVNASRYFQEAYDKSNIPAFYATFAKFRDASNMAKQGSHFLSHGQFTNALAEFRSAYDKADRDVFKSYVNATASAVTGYDLLRERKVSEAVEYFRNALLMHRNLFKEDVDALINCKDALLVAAEGQLLLTQRKFSQALAEFKKAYEMSHVREVKYLLSRLNKIPYERGSYCNHDEL